MKGLVEFSLNASEQDVRNNISMVIQNSVIKGYDATKCGPDDFEFVKRTGHMFIIPEFAPGFEMDLSALKTLIGQGDVYVRLIVDHASPSVAATWSDDSDFESSPGGFTFVSRSSISHSASPPFISTLQ